MKSGKYLFYFLLHLFLFQIGVFNIYGQTADWKKTYSDDLETARATISADHPGMVDTQNPLFAVAMNAAYQEALAVAKTVKNYNSYRFALMRFINHFQDGHLSISFQKPFENIKEAGVFTDYQNGNFIVRNVDERYGVAAANLTDSKLVSCDAHQAADVFQKKILSWRGRSNIEADWYGYAPVMFVDYNLENLPAPKICRFLKNGKAINLSLKWNDTTAKELNEKMQKIFSVENRSLGLEHLDDGKVLWVNLPTFNVNMPEQISSMNNLIGSFKNELNENKKPNLVVFDLRGNSGGSSSWGNQLAAELFGADWMSRAAKWLGDGVYTEWRVSPDNLKSLEGIVNQQRQRHGAGSPTVLYFQRLSDSMQSGLNNNTSFITADDHSKLVNDKPEKAPISSKVIVLTNSSCFSACLDFMDVMRANPAVLHVGQITGVDTIYMESWSKSLPSGMAQIGYPMKVYRNRRRANNQPYIPTISFNGDLNETEKVRAWILQNYGRW